jgi:hypothetical protein
VGFNPDVFLIVAAVCVYSLLEQFLQLENQKPHPALVIMLARLLTTFCARQVCDVESLASQDDVVRYRNEILPSLREHIDSDRRA